MSQTAHIIGAGRTDFQRHFQREGKSLRHIILEAGALALADAGVDAREVNAAVVGNFAGGLFTGQLHLGSFISELDPKLRGLPTFHVEAACASGSAAVLTAAKLVMGEIHDVVLVVGAEQQKTMPPAAVAQVLAAAGDFQPESARFGDFMFPKLFGHIARLYETRWGLTQTDLARVAVKNRAHARLNPLAQMRDSSLSLQEAVTESPANQCIAPPLKVSDCSQITDGGAAVLVCSGRFAARLAPRPAIRLLGFGHTTDYLALEKKDVPEFSIATRAADQAYAMAGLTPAEIDGAEFHDCFSISEIIAYEITGLAPRGQGARLLETGATALPVARAAIGTDKPRRIVPVNAGGGLIGDGHPVGATGVRQVVEAYRQLNSAAGKYQIEGAQRILTYNMGGSFTTNVVMIWGK